MQSAPAQHSGCVAPDAVCAPSGSGEVRHLRFRPVFQCGEHAAQLKGCAERVPAAAASFATVTAATTSSVPMTLQRPPPDLVPQMDRAPRNIMKRASVQTRSAGEAGR
jgi:hypothetical protein